MVDMKNKIKIAAFSNTSWEIIVKKWDFQKIFLPSDKVKDSEIVIKELEDTDYFICLGQKPAIKNIICLELVAKNNADEIKTNFEIEKLIEEFKKNDIQIIKSTNPGKSYCNQVYWNSLNYIKDNSLNCKILFVHVPFEKKYRKHCRFCRENKKINPFVYEIYLFMMYNNFVKMEE